MQILYKLRDYRETFKFEKEHPLSLRWDDKYKLYQLTQNKEFQGIWLKEGGQLFGEILMSWQSDNVVHIEGFTILPSHRGKGYGHDLVRLALEWARESGYEWVVGEARKGASWKIFENFAATPLIKYTNWNKTGEDYMGFKIEL